MGKGRQKERGLRALRHRASPRAQTGRLPGFSPSPCAQPSAEPPAERDSNRYRRAPPPGPVPFRPRTFPTPKSTGKLRAKRAPCARVLAGFLANGEARWLRERPTDAERGESGERRRKGERKSTLRTPEVRVAAWSSCCGTDRSCGALLVLRDGGWPQQCHIAAPLQPRVEPSAPDRISRQN